MSDNSQPPQQSAFGRLYPNLFFWASYGGTVSIRPATETEVEVWLGDAGGYPIDGCRRGPLDDALQAAEKFAGRWRVQTRRLQQELANDPPEELRHEPYIRVAGWPPIPNPRYDSTASQPV